MQERFKNLLSLLIRIGLSGVLLVWLFSKVDYKHTWEAVKGADVILGVSQPGAITEAMIHAMAPKAHRWHDTPMAHT